MGLGFESQRNHFLERKKAKIKNLKAVVLRQLFFILANQEIGCHYDVIRDYAKLLFFYFLEDYGQRGYRKNCIHKYHFNIIAQLIIWQHH
jgi:hypothetical protein